MGVGVSGDGGPCRCGPAVSSQPGRQGPAHADRFHHRVKPFLIAPWEWWVREAGPAWLLTGESVRLHFTQGKRETPRW